MIYLHTHTMNYYAFIKNGTNYWFIYIYTHTQNIMLNWRSQTYKNTCCIIPPIRNSSKDKYNLERGCWTTFSGTQNCSGDRELTEKECREHFRMMEVFCIMFVVVATKVYIFAKTLYLKWILFIYVKLCKKSIKLILKKIMYRHSWEAVLYVYICVYDTVNMNQGGTEGQIQKLIGLVGKKNPTFYC